MTELRIQAVGATPALEREWEDLARETRSPAFLHPGWILAWARAFCSTPVTVLSARRDGKLVSVFPYVQRHGTRRAPANWHTPLFGFIAREESDRVAIATALLRDAAVGVDIAFLSREDAGLQACLEAAQHARRRVLVRTIQRSPYVDSSAGDWASYCATLSPKMRRELRRLRRRLEERGEVTVEFSDGSRGLAEALAEGFALEGSGWKEKHGTAIRSEARTERFYTEVAHWAASRGELMLAFLRLDGTAIAFDLCLESEGHTYALKGGFDPAFRRFGPGMLLTYESLRRGFESGLASYELLGDADRYKLVWTGTVRERVRFQAFNVRSPAGALAWTAWAGGRPAIRSLQAAVRRPG